MEMLNLTKHSTHFIYGYMEKKARVKTRCHHVGYSIRLATTVLLYAQSLRQDSRSHCFYYTCRGASAAMRNRSMCRVGSKNHGLIYLVKCTLLILRTSLWRKTYVQWEAVYMLTFIISSLKTCISAGGVLTLVTK